MLFHVNPKSGEPIHRQIERQVKNAVAAGALKKGEALPSLRALAVELGINPNTAAQAYRALAAEGVIETLAGGGSRVAEVEQGLLKSEKLRRLRPLARQLAVEAAHLRVSDEALRHLLAEEMKALGGDK